jgi:hypothetical protein
LAIDGWSGSVLGRHRRAETGSDPEHGGACIKIIAESVRRDPASTFSGRTGRTDEQQAPSRPATHHGQGFAQTGAR